MPFATKLCVPSISRSYTSSSATASMDAILAHCKPFSTVAADDLKLPKEFRAAVGLDAEGKPAWFLFDMIAFWELICRIDEKMFDKLSDDEYESVSLGKTIDAIEEKWPFSAAYKAEMKRGYDRAIE